MNPRPSSRPSLARLNGWLLLALTPLLLILLSTSLAHAQDADTLVNLSNTPSRPTRAYADPNEGISIRNHGTGLRLGVELAAARGAVRGGHLPAILEVGAFHQLALGRVGSVQIEALYFRAPATPAAVAAKGLRLPVLLVVNPFDNVSVHLGPQLQWQRTGRESESGSAAAPLTVGLVAGGEAHAGPVRVGLRYGMPLELLTNLSAAGHQLGHDWKTGQLQVYLGMNLFDRKS